MHVLVIYIRETVCQFHDPRIICILVITMLIDKFFVIFSGETILRTHKCRDGGRAASSASSN